MSTSSSSRTYERVAVLLLHWDGNSEDDRVCGEEVLMLRKAFEEDFKFDIEIVKLQLNSASPQVQLNKAVNDLVYTNDRTDQSCLLIVYYSGHGLIVTARPHELILTSGRGVSSASSRRTPETNRQRANWAQAELVLREHALSDTLVILDCCFAGNVLTEFFTSKYDRCYEVMVATKKGGFTISPGPGSYTAILVESLKELQGLGRGVSTWELAQTTMRKQGWRGDSNLHPVCLAKDGRHIVLAPLSATSEKTAKLEEVIGGLVPRAAKWLPLL